MRNPRDWAGQVLSELGLAHGSAGAAVRVLGWHLERRSLGATTGGHRALLIPTDDGGFCVVVDPAPSPSDLFAGPVSSHSVTEWRIAHEIAHSLRYSAGHPPRRRWPVATDEEEFCDAFADAFMVGAALRRHVRAEARSVISIARRAQVGLPVASRVLHESSGASVLLGKQTQGQAHLEVEWAIGLDHDAEGTYWPIPTGESDGWRSEWSALLEGDLDGISVGRCVRDLVVVVVPVLDRAAVALRATGS